MKLGAIKRCCIEEKEFYIYESDGGEQWIGTHTAAWPVEGDLKLTEGSIAAIFDLAPKRRRRWISSLCRWVQAHACM